MDKTQREYYLRQQLKAIQDELGERDPAEAEVEELRGQLAELELPEVVRKQADRELSRLEKLPPASAEHGVIRTWLEWIASLPWSVRTDDNLDLAHAREVLDADHYDIEKIKDRIIEFLAVRKLTHEGGGSSILCFVGPPGVGKTSLGRSIARAMGRQFERISAGGVRDEAEIRGHRRTYIGAMPGVIIRALRDAGSENPVFMIDEIDKMGADYRGDPASAMLEVLDPEQNSTFRDHYLDVPYDLSRVMFITTANTLDTIPGAAARPDGDHPARGLHGGGEAPDRQALPRPAPDLPQRAQALAGRVLRRRAAGDHRGVHARGGRAQPRARDRLGLPQGRAPGRRGDVRAQADRERAEGARAARPRRASPPTSSGAPPSRASRRAWRGRRPAATCCSSRRARCPARASSRSPASSAT